MRREDFFTGEELLDSSPQNSTYISEQEAVANASFGAYSYDPGSRMRFQQQQMVPQGYDPTGYNNLCNMYNGAGLGMGNPALQQGYNYQNNFYSYGSGMGNPVLQQGYNYYSNTGYGMGNPVLQQGYGYNNPYQQQMQQNYQVYIPPVNISGSEYLPPMNYEEQIEQLKMEYWMKEQDMLVNQSMNNNANMYGSNYYGIPFYNPYQNSTVMLEASRKIQEIQDQARECRARLNMNLSKLARNICGESYEEDTINDIYQGHVYESPIKYQDIYEQNRFNNLVPFDNSDFYRQHHAAVTAEFNKIIPADSDMKQTFENSALLAVNYRLEDEMHRRRDAGNIFDQNTFSYFVRNKAMARSAEKNGIIIGNQMQATVDNYKRDLLNSFPTLSQTATLTDDGVLNITCNFGSKSGQTYSVYNENEARYDKEREDFNKFIGSINHSLYLDSPNASD